LMFTCCYYLMFMGFEMVDFSVKRMKS